MNSLHLDINHTDMFYRFCLDFGMCCRPLTTQVSGV